MTNSNRANNDVDDNGTSGAGVDAAGIGNTVATGHTSTTADNNEVPDGANDNNKEDRGISLQELIYGASSFHAVVKPVSVTMLLAALSVIYINTEATKAAGEQALEQTYQVFSISDDHSTATSLGLGLINSLIIVFVIGGMTFLIVLLYKYRCLKILFGYMIVASTMLLGFLGGQMFRVAINKYGLAIDQISFYVTMYNFAIVGVLAVFYQKGIPTFIDQAYLVATSVIVAWQLSYFNEWMAWSLLIMLAFYDLFAVLTPCGPLKALVNLMSKDDAPSMPGLLYTAGLPENAIRPGRQRSRGSESGRNERRAEEQQNTDTRDDGNDANDEDDGNINDTWRSNGSRGNAVANSNSNGPETREEPSATILASPPNRQNRRSTRRNEEAASSENVQHVQSESPLQQSASPTTTVPLAIAKVYKLPLVSPNETVTSITSLDTSSPTAYRQQQFSATELRTVVEVRLPRHGGRIEATRNKRGEPRYVIYDKDGEVKRTLTVDENGSVMEIIKGSDDGSLDREDNNIKLGLGDFIFYSVLVSKAAENGFAPFVACFLSTLAGLGGTLVLLAVYHHALPALPISIFIAVVMFVLTIYCMEPWIQDMWRSGPFYV